MIAFVFPNVVGVIGVLLHIAAVTKGDIVGVILSLGMIYVANKDLSNIKKKGRK